MPVKPKRYLGQHFLHDKNTAQKIANTLTGYGAYNNLLEIGPGTGALTQYLIKLPYKLKLIEIDKESVTYLRHHFSNNNIHIIETDFLKSNLSEIFTGEQFAVIGNFPYNISTQIVFKILANRCFIPEMAGMFQKEVAQRICEKPGSKTYGILSVLTQAYYQVEYLFTVNETVFLPPPKVKSGVIRLQRIRTALPCKEELFFTLVKTAFNQRRKTLRNSIKSINTNKKEHWLLDKRPEQLSVDDFIYLTQSLETAKD